MVWWCALDPKIPHRNRSNAGRKRELFYTAFNGGRIGCQNIGIEECISAFWRVVGTLRCIYTTHITHIMAAPAPTTAPTTAPNGRPAISPSHPTNDPEKTGYDPAKRWTNYFNILTAKMTREGQEAFREDAYIRNEARDCANCDQWRDYLFAYSPMIRFMSSKIGDLNGRLDAENVQCRRCPTRRVVGEDGQVQYVRQGGGFSPDHGILICANEMRNRGHLEDTLAHEMVHAWDHLRWKVDWADLRHAACTEVRDC